MLLRYRSVLTLLGLGFIGSSLLFANEPIQLTSQKTPTEPGRLNPLFTPPTPARLTNQQLAQDIAMRLRQSGVLQGQTLDIAVDGGIVELGGELLTNQQQAAVVQIVRDVPGVAHVRDLLMTREHLNLVPVQALGPPMQGPPPRREADFGPAITQPPEPTPIFQGVPGGMPGGMQGGMPYAGQSMGTNPPRMPPYAWPTFAPYNNYSRVASPTLYPLQAWPYIGPMYPFPKIPFGWRSITLTWQDGYWWYGRNSRGHEWWRVRYW